MFLKNLNSYIKFNSIIYFLFGQVNLIKFNFYFSYLYNETLII